MQVLDKQLQKILSELQMELGDSFVSASPLQREKLAVYKEKTEILEAAMRNIQDWQHNEPYNAEYDAILRNINKRSWDILNLNHNFS